MTLLRKTFDETGNSNAILSSDAGYKYYIVGLSIDNSESDFGDRISVNLEMVAPVVAIFGDYDSGNRYEMKMSIN
ncbi:MAG: hypothetical protein U9O94_04365, partial [Nanoarchaeota archaeon]|nr:hypothetical protein [Nanoarchaeota archaeon]